MEDQPKRRARLAKAVKEPEEDEVSQKESEPPKSRGKRKAVVPELPVEKPAKKTATKKAKMIEEPAISTEQSNGVNDNEGNDDVVVGEKKAPAKKSRAAKKNTNDDLKVDAEEPKTKGKKTATSKASKAKVEKDAPVTKEEAPAPAKRGGAKSKSNSTTTTSKQPASEPEEPVSKPAPKGRGKAKDKTDKMEVDAHDTNKLDDAPPAKPSAKGRKKATADDDAPVVDPEPKPATSKSKKKTNTNDTNGDVPTVTQRKRTKAPEDIQDVDTVPKAKKTKAAAAPKMNKCATDYSSLSFALDDEAKQWNCKISSWNVAGLRGWIGKGGLEFIEHEQPDIVCLQETKCTEDQLPEEARQIKGYHPYWLCKPGGYAGVAIYSKKMPIHVVYGLGDEEQDQDGRLLTAEYEKFFLVCVYVPNAGKKLVTLPKRMRWDEKFHQYLRGLDAKKPVILCGDMNVAHEEIDLANPKTNRRNAGFTQEERDGMSTLLSYGFVDTFRRLYPERTGAYTFWTYMGGARAKNVGWRLDYFITSERLADKVTDNVIRSQVYGSDHCPVTLFLKI
uniref:DNA-(apurinic or apyrimidinic site) endonuclease n=1 Tax=Anopheles farauti TaxID=69004 RepID=A0A182QQ96_9DIPT